ncbi:MAG TPA: bacillithiol system redox-active protein YtxJ [Pedobacter sp.]|jgi:bacillithiol system protein YtxJ
MNSIALETQDQLEDINSFQGYSIIFKHNTTCPISKNTRADFEKKANLLPNETNVYFLDLLTYRDISNSIAEKFDIKHESPQLLVIKNGECKFHQSLYDISAEDAAQAMSSN